MMRNNSEECVEVLAFLNQEIIKCTDSFNEYDASCPPRMLDLLVMRVYRKGLPCNQGFRMKVRVYLSHGTAPQEERDPEAMIRDQQEPPTI